MNIELPEEDCQAIVLAIARLSVERPGWQNYLTEIAERFKARELFDTFRQYKIDENGTIPSI